MSPLIKRFINCMALLLMATKLHATSQAGVVQFASQLSYYTEEYAPGNFTERGDLVGISVDTLKLIWQKLGVPEQPISVVPWARGYRIVQYDQGSVLFSMARTQQRETKFRWVGPIFSSTHVVVAKSSRNIKVESFEGLFGFRAAALRNDIGEVSMRNASFPSRNLVQVADLKQAYFMLRSDRVDLIVITRFALKHILDKYQESLDEYQIVWQISRVENYFAFHKDTPDIFINTFQQAFDSTVVERTAIKRRYKLPDEEF